MNFKVEIQQLAKAEEASWRQKSRYWWLKDGDKNTKFFQKILTLTNYWWGRRLLKIKNSSRKKFSTSIRIFIQDESWRPTATFEGMGCLTVEESKDLETDFGEEEVLVAINSCTPDKACGPNGFTMAFYHKNWDIVKYEVLGALNHFHHNCHMVRSFNASFIPLTPKRN